MTQNHHLIVKKFRHKAKKISSQTPAKKAAKISNFNFGSAFFTDTKKVPQLTSKTTEFLQNLPNHSLIIIREYHLCEFEREQFARKICRLARENFSQKKLKIFIGKDFALARKIKADGVHLSDLDLNLEKILQRQSASKLLLSFAIHHQKSLKFLPIIKPNLIFVSPVFATTSHPENEVLGVKKLQKILAKKEKICQRNPKIFCQNFALGGINNENYRQLLNLNLHGFGAIDFFKNFLK